MIDQHYRIKFIDFGSCSRMAPKGDKTKYFNLFNGTLHFASPEILQGRPFRGPEAEIWALAVLLYTIFFGESPFRDQDDILGHRLKFPPEVENTLYVDLMRKMFNPNPQLRPTLAEIKKHPWFAEFD